MSELGTLQVLKGIKRDLWEKHGWSCKDFTHKQNILDNELRYKINQIEKKGIYCVCSECNIENETVDYTSETPNRMVCEKCSDELRKHIKDKCGLL